MSGPLRVGVDVGGTFTKAVAVDSAALRLVAAQAVPTSHGARLGASAGVADALRLLLNSLGPGADAVEYAAFSTTQAMNALLEGDVPRVGVVGIGRAPELRPARKRTRVGAVKLAPGRELETEHEFLDATHGLDNGAIDAAIGRLVEAGCGAVAASGAYAVDDPELELRVADRARAAGLPACCGHELTGAYGLETRTVSAAINASILPAVELTAGVVERALRDAGVDAPLLVLRGDGGAMSMEAFRRRPSFTVGSGPAAGVAAALQVLELTDAIVLECGGTSSNISVIKHGRPVLRSIKVMGRTTSIRSIDSWVVGAAGGSMARLNRRRIAEVGPRSAHIAGLDYACFAAPDELTGADLTLEPIAPREGDPSTYVAVHAGDRRFALTATCAANALGIVPEESHAHAPETVVAAFAPLARHLRTTPGTAARAVLDAAVEKIVAAAREAARQHDLGPGVPVVALGGAADALAGEVARRLDAQLVRPANPEVLSSVGAALSLVRAEAQRSATPGSNREDRIALARDAERECVESGAAPATVSVETSFDPGTGVIRATATGAVALEAGAARREPTSEPALLGAAASVLEVPGETLELVVTNDFYSVYSENGSGRVAVVDRLGGVALAEDAKRVLVGEGDQLTARLRDEVDAATVNLGVASMVPRVALVCGARILDMSDARHGEEIVSAAERALADHDGPAVAVLAR
jgi:N-methylhydantoinase A/oxoprolinase/acetone carboxylase beta subunit